jgi:hypothetical protein
MYHLPDGSQRQAAHCCCERPMPRPALLINQTFLSDIGLERFLFSLCRQRASPRVKAMTLLKQKSR